MATTKAASTRPVGAAAKLAHVQAHIQDVDKTGFNAHQKFRYFQEHGIFGLLKPFQRELQFAIVTDVVDVEHDGNMTSGTAVTRFIDVELSPEDPRYEIVQRLPMQATDNAGWGAAKLLTYANKFALQKLLEIPTEDMPEAEAEAVPSTAKGGKGNGRGRPSTIAEGTVAELRSALIDGQADPNRVKAKLQGDFGVGTIEALKPEHLAAFRAWVLEETAKGASA